MGSLAPTALYALAAPSTPEPVREQVLERAAADATLPACAANTEDAAWCNQAQAHPRMWTATKNGKSAVEDPVSSAIEFM